VTHVRELIAQNRAALVRLFPDPSRHLFDRLGRRQLGRPIPPAGVQSEAPRP
jgi:hypothetical protein